jgi:hypothetical protein
LENGRVSVVSLGQRDTYGVDSLRNIKPQSLDVAFSSYLEFRSMGKVYKLSDPDDEIFMAYRKPVEEECT